MRLRVVICAVVTGLALAGTPVAGAQTPAPSCRAGERVAAAGPATLRVHRSTLYGCMRGQRRATLVARGSGPSDLVIEEWTRPRLAGSWAAAATALSWKCTDRRLAAVNLRTGERRSWISGSGVSDSDANGCRGVGLEPQALVLRYDGVVAAAITLADGTDEVVLGAGEADERVDVASQVDPASLRFAGETLQWSRDDGPRSLPVPPVVRGTGRITLRHKLPGAAAPKPAYRVFLVVRNHEDRVVARRTLGARPSDVTLRAGAYVLSARVRRCAGSCTTLSAPSRSCVLALHLGAGDAFAPVVRVDSRRRGCELWP